MAYTVTSPRGEAPRASGCIKPYCDLRGRIKGTARALYPVHVERAQYEY